MVPEILWPFFSNLISHYVLGLSIYVLQQMAQAARGDTIFESRLYDSILCFFVLTLFTNLGSTSMCFIPEIELLKFLPTVLIAGRIHWLHSQVRDASRIFVSCPLFGTSARAGCSAIFVATVISESAAIYSATLVVILILYTLKIHTVYLLLDAVGTLFLPVQICFIFQIRQVTQLIVSLFCSQNKINSTKAFAGYRVYFRGHSSSHRRIYRGNSSSKAGR